MPYKNKEDQRARNIRWYQANREEQLKRHKEYYLKNKGIMNKKGREYYFNNIDKIRAYRNTPEQKAKYNLWEKNRKKNDFKLNINNRIKVGIYRSIKGNKAGRHWEDLVGYTLIDLIKHLKKTIPNGYVWQDFMDGELHIDHIIPKSVFNYNSPEHIDFKRCWSLKNLRLLPAHENQIKYNKLTNPFQPALKL